MLKIPHLKDLKIAKIEFTLNTLCDTVLPTYKGSTIRGAFGHVFKDVMCIVHHGICDKCNFVSLCIFKKIFDSPAPTDSKRLRNYQSLPHPYIIEPPQDFKNMYVKSEKIKFSLILIGSAVSFFPYFAYAFGLAGLKGLGRRKAGKFEIIKIINEKDNFELYNIKTEEFKYINSFYTFDDFIKKDAVREDRNYTSILNFETPTRIVFDARPTSKLEFHIFIRNLLRRISNLYFFYCKENDPNDTGTVDREGEDIDFEYYIEKAYNVKISNDLQWTSHARYSNRQHKQMKLSGFIGKSVFLNTPPDFLWIIRLGELLHVGKNTTFGLGKYKIEYIG